MARTLIGRVVIERYLTEDDGDDGDVISTYSETADGQIDGLPLIEILGMIEMGRMVYLAAGGPSVTEDDEAGS
jgi:hypothetical protein